MQVLRPGRRTHYAALLAMLALSSYTHLWNPAGFPDVFFDEGIYMRRAMTTLETGNPQEGYFYDHPYLGQVILAGAIKLAGFPATVERALEASYLVPRVLMGLLAVLDTFLIYKITEKRFGRKAAMISGVLFASMPMTWMFRRILLDGLLVPLMLSSLLLALHSKDSRHPGALVAASSCLLGLAVFTKVTAVTLIPVVAYVVASGRGPRALAGWLPPVLAIPMAWPGVALHLGHLEYWIRDVLWHAGRGTSQFWPITGTVFSIDPVMTSLGFAGFAFSALRRNLMLVLWFAPFLLFVNAVGFFQYFHYILIVPAMCVAAGFMLEGAVSRIRTAGARNAACAAIILGLGAYGGVTSGVIISGDLTSAQFSAMQYAIDTFDGADSTLLSSPVYSWVLSGVHGNDNVFLDYADILYGKPETRYLYMVVDPHLLLDQGRGEEIVLALEGTRPVRSFELDSFPDTESFPFQGYRVANEGRHVEIRTDKAGPWP